MCATRRTWLRVKHGARAWDAQCANTRLPRHADSAIGAMQYNLVVATNEGAIRLWERLGFTITGRLPEAFRHAEHDFVDAVVMYRLL